MTAEELRAFTDAVLDDGTVDRLEPLRPADDDARGLGRDGAPHRFGGLGPGRKRLAEPLARREEVLGHDLHVGEHRHEVRVARPARHDVLVEVAGDRAAGDLTEVQPTLNASGR